MTVRIASVTASFVVAALGLTDLPVRAAMNSPVPARRYDAPASEAPAAKPPTASSAPSAVGASAPAATAPSGAGSAPAEPRQPVSAAKSGLAGTVVYVKGGRVVAEITGGAKVADRFRLYDVAFRPKGEVLAVKALDGVMFLVEPVGSASAAVGYRLARVDE